MHKCHVDFQGNHISSGIGHNKSEAKKDAAANAIKIVAPNIYKEVLSDYQSPLSQDKSTAAPTSKPASAKKTSSF
jgi:hypothetical protein